MGLITAGQYFTSGTSRFFDSDTYIEKGSPLSGSGTITKIKTYCPEYWLHMSVGFFDPSTLINRCYTYLGEFSPGAIEVTGLSLDAESGDLIGSWNNGGGVSLETSSGDGRWYYKGIDLTHNNYVSQSNVKSSLYAEGEEAVTVNAQILVVF